MDFIIMMSFFIVALLYSSVGHGGASGYLAVMSFLSIPHSMMSASALILNLLVAGLAFYHFRKNGHFIWGLTWPFLITSIPFAFIGGLITVPFHYYAFLLATVLFYTAIRLSFCKKKQFENSLIRKIDFKVSLIVGMFLGFISGIVGVGGGIFLSPLLILMCWANPKQTSATSALFIWANSLFGLMGRFFKDQLIFMDIAELFPIILIAFIGGLIGAYLGAKKYSFYMLRYVLSVVLFIASIKMVIIVL